MDDAFNLGTVRPMARTYNQDCILAHALDLLGERWTLLILRELFLGPQRFGDLQASLPGIGANLLSKRLKELDEAGLVEATSAGESRSGYKLSSCGDALRPAIRELMCWSIDYFLTQPESSPARECLYSNNLRPDSVALAIELFATYRPNAALNYVAHIIIDDFPYTFFYMNQDMTARRGADAPSVAKISTDVETIMKSFRGELTLAQAKPRMKFSGDQKAISHLFECIVHTKEYAEQAQEPLQAAAS